MIGPFFPQIYFQKFGKLPFILTPLGFICSSQVYLDLGDLDLINDLGHILDFYRQLDFEGSSLSILVPGHKGRETFCKCFLNLLRNGNQGIVYRPHQRKVYCVYCDELICELCADNHPNHNITELCMPRERACSCCGCPNSMPIIWYRKYSDFHSKMICLKCADDKEYLRQTDPIIRFNIAEWIPIKNFLENRNKNSELYCRKIRYTFTERGCKLNLIHRNVEYNLTSESTLLADAVWRMGEKFNVPEDLSKKILDYTETLKYTCLDVNRVYPDIINF